jgi:hypothetical protein
MRRTRQKLGHDGVSALRLRINHDVRFITKDEGAVLLHLQQGRYQSLNGTATVIWNKINDGATSEDIAAALCARYPGVPRERIENELRAFLAQLESKGLVTVEPER